jgi:hypothetical protein
MRAVLAAAQKIAHTTSQSAIASFLKMNFLAASLARQMSIARPLKT